MWVITVRLVVYNTAPFRIKVFQFCPKSTSLAYNLEKIYNYGFGSISISRHAQMLLNRYLIRFVSFFFRSSCGLMGIIWLSSFLIFLSTSNVSPFGLFLAASGTKYGQYPIACFSMVNKHLVSCTSEFHRRYTFYDTFKYISRVLLNWFTVALVVLVTNFLRINCENKQIRFPHRSLQRFSVCHYERDRPIEVQQYNVIWRFPMWTLPYLFKFVDFPLYKACYIQAGLLLSLPFQRSEYNRF